jgi:hypothetical protein
MFNALPPPRSQTGAQQNGEQSISKKNSLRFCDDNRSNPSGNSVPELKPVAGLIRS